MSWFPHKNRAAVGGSLENFILDRNFQSRSKSRIFLIFGPSGHFLSRFGGNPCSKASCGVVTFSLVLLAFQVVLGSWNPESTICPFQARLWPLQAPKTLRSKGKMANFEAKNTVKHGKNAKRTNGTHFTRVREGGNLIIKCCFSPPSGCQSIPAGTSVLYPLLQRIAR